MVKTRPAIDRFWPKVNRTATCWLWTAAVDRDGYGKFRDIGNRYWYAHRWSYEHFVGPVPDGCEVDHLCKVRHCVNPAHLEPVSHRENCLRSDNFVAHEARRTHCPQGHPYDETNTYVSPTGGRHCRICKRATFERFIARRKNG